MSLFSLETVLFRVLYFIMTALETSTDTTNEGSSNTYIIRPNFQHKYVTPLMIIYCCYKIQYYYGAITELPHPDSKASHNSSLIILNPSRV